MVTTFPTVHRNGTSRERLLDDNRAAADAIRLAIAAVEAAAPNARDFYTQDPHAYAKARAEHIARLHGLGAMLDDFQKICEHVAR